MQSLVRRLNSSIRNKIILPYFLLALIVVVLGATVAFFVVASSFQERLDQRLRQSALKTSQALVDFEDAQLSRLRPIALNGPNAQERLPSTAAAFATKNSEQLGQILRNGLNFYQMSQLVAFDAQGRVLTDQHAENARAWPTLTDSSVQSLIGVRYILENKREIIADEIADKYTSIVVFELADGSRLPLLYTVVPIRQTDPLTKQPEIIGGLIATESLANIIQSLQQANDAFYTAIYDSEGQVLASNTPDQQEVFAIPESTRELLLGQAVSERALRTVPVNKRDFMFAYSPLRIRNQLDGYFSVAVEIDSVFDTWQPTRNLIVALTLLALVAVVALGNAIALRITQPLQALASTATAIAQGHLDQRSTIASRDEVGTLASVLNEMTTRLVDLYRASRELGFELGLHGILRAAQAAIQRLGPTVQLAAILPAAEGWAIYRAGYEHPTSMPPFDQAALEDLPAFSEISAIKPAYIAALHDLEPRWLLPLRTQQRTIGWLVIGAVPATIEAEPIRESLVAIASMTTTALQNALLYAEVEQEAGRNRAILQSIADAVIVCNPHGAIMLANSSALSLLGSEPEALYGKQFSALPFVPLEQTRDVFAQPDTPQQQLYMINQRTVSRSVSPVISSDQQLLGEVVVLHDVTAQRVVDRAKTDFIATISHELRTPLTPIKGYLDLLLSPDMGGELSAEQLGFAQIIQKHVQSMSTLLNNVILLASIEAGTMTPHVTPVALAAVVQAAVKPLRKDIQAKALTLTIDVPPSLPRVLADVSQLEIALSKLIDNAQRYTATGSITIQARSVQDQLEVKIKDTGRGIAADDLPHLFTRFRRGGEQAGLVAGERGSGLGLAIARQLIEQQGGALSITSQVKVGTTVVFTIPGAGDAHTQDTTSYQTVVA